MKTFLLILMPFLLQAQNLLLFDDTTVNVYAVDLNGTNEWAYKSNPSGIDLEPDTSWTLMAWVKTPDITNSGFDVSARTNTYAYWSLQRSSNVPSFSIYDGTGARTAVGTTISNNTWYHIAITIGTDSMRLYQNGVNVFSSDALIVGSFNDSPTIDIGAWSELGILPSNATVGEVQIIMGYSLSASEINQNYVRGMGGLNYLGTYPSGRIVAWYKWGGEDDATFLEDASGSGNNLTGNNVDRAGDQVIINGGYK